MRKMAVFNNLKIKIVGMFCIALFAMAVMQYVITESFPDEAYITEAFIISDDITVSECIVETTACMSEGKGSVSFYEDACKMLTEIHDIYSADASTPKISYVNDDIKECVKAEYMEDRLVISDVVTKQKASGNTYFHSKISVLSDISTAEKIKSSIDSFFSDNSNDHITYIKIKACKDGKLSASDCKRFADKIYKRLNAESISVHTDDAKNNVQYISYGYSKKLTDYIDSGRKKINLQLSISYDGQNDCTDITLGYPIINDSY